MRKFRVHCNSIATRERFERALQAQGFKCYVYKSAKVAKQEFDRIKLERINPDSIIYYIVWEDDIYSLSDMPRDLAYLLDIDHINGRQVTSKAKQLRQQVDKLKEEQQ